jgi:hypothetical protein
MSKPTLATVKKFVRQNRARLLVRNLSDFDGMTDCVERCADRGFRSAAPGKYTNDLGIAGAWFVFNSRDSISPLNESGMSGFHIYNCCGSFDLAIPDERG